MHLQNRKGRRRLHRSNKMTSIAGYLKQKSDGIFFTSMLDRFCILDKDEDDNKLWIYQNKQDHVDKLKPIEIIFVKYIESQSIQINPSNTKQFTFWIQNNKHSQYFLFEASSELQCTTWCEKLIENQQSTKRKSLTAMRKIAILKKRSAEVSIQSLTADRELSLGWCQSELSRKKFHSRYFVLTSIDLRYWKNHNDHISNKPPKVCIPLHLISNVQQIDPNTLQICVQFQDENHKSKLRLFELHSKDQIDITNFALGLSKSNWRRQELKEHAESPKMLIRKISRPTMFSSSEKNDSMKPSHSLVLHQKTTFFRVNAPEIDHSVDGNHSEDEFGKDDNNDIEMNDNNELENHLYAELKRRWSMDLRSSILKSDKNHSQKKPVRNRVEFSSKTKIVNDYDDPILNDLDDELSSNDEESSFDESIQFSCCDILYKCIVSFCRSNTGYRVQLD